MSIVIASIAPLLKVLFSCSKSNSKEICFQGKFIHSKGFDVLEIVNGYLVVDRKSGKIVSLSMDEPTGCDAMEMKVLGEKEIMIPGFVDSHTHAPQFLNKGVGYELELLDWLNKYTFPTEAKFKDLQFARKSYEKCVKDHLRHGSTTCIYFATIHTDAAIELGKITTKVGQRAFIGKVNMDRNSPDFYVEKTDESLTETKRFIQGIKGLNSELVTPIITPRFVPTCTYELMRGLADLAKEHDIPIQSHVSENLSEILWVQALHPDEATYTQCYDTVGLLGPKTIMAHGIFLTDEELDLLKERQCTISHCANSNFSLNSGTLNARRLLAKGINVSLGTDVSGGSSASMVDAIRKAMTASRVTMFHHRDIPDVNEQIVSMKKSGDLEKKDLPERLSIPEVMYMATIAGAKAVGLEDKIGNFEPGKYFDALRIDVSSLIYDDFNRDSPLDLLERYLNCGDDREINEIYVAGIKRSQ